MTRLVPCPECLFTAEQHPYEPPDDNRVENGGLYEELALGGRRTFRLSQESYTGSEADSGVGNESTCSSRAPSIEGRPAGDFHQDEPRFGWTIEECILAAHDDSRSVLCPTHGDTPLSRVTPDVVFLDLGERFLVRPENVKRGRLLGRGAFGFVFRGQCRSRGSQALVDVAMKMLQPVQPGPGARQSAVVAWRAAQGKWERDPLQYACKAYCTARQELGILLALRHPNIVPLVGVCASPLAIVLDLAPCGALDACLRHHRRSGARLSAHTLRQLVLQTARAVEYLHRQRIIYRDLKSENVLVWRLPEPHDRNAEEASRAHVKLADYGISRLTPPGGAKGFGGTEGFMAPEIMRHNGEEEYTEKVDCFSFGMFVYELVTLRQPFEGHESVKECILEGGRPPVARRQTLAHPPHALDLMVACWAHDPRDRPSASQIVSVASAPEFARHADAVPLAHGAPVAAATAGPPIIGTPHAAAEPASAPQRELWLACSNSRIDLLLGGGGRGFSHYHGFATPQRPTAACTVGARIWLGDRAGTVIAHSAADASLQFRADLSIEGDGPEVVNMVYVVSLGLVAVALANGRLVLLHADGGTTLTEIVDAGHVLAMCAVGTELWTGGERGRLNAYNLDENGQILNCRVLELDETEHGITDGESSTVLRVTTDEDGRHVWTYAYPGCVVRQWEVTTGRATNKLDCSKLVPCSESLKSIAIEEHLSPGRCQVTALAASRGDLYIGTAWGCLIIADARTMRPVTVFRPHEEDVRAVVPIAHSDAEPLVATVGRGYRDLLGRYTDKETSDSEGNVRAGVSRRDCMYAMLWRADNWAVA